MRRIQPLFLSALLLSLAACPDALARSVAPHRPPGGPADELPRTSRTVPDVRTPLVWLVKSQNPDGSWGVEPGASADIATTAISGIALVRFGSTWKEGPHRESLRRALEFVVLSIEKTPADQIRIVPAAQPAEARATKSRGRTDPYGEITQPERKLGRNINTFLAAQFLAEALPSVRGEADAARFHAALDACAGRIQRAQQVDGSFEKDGWAPVLSSTFANRALYAARRQGATVRGDVLEKAKDYMARNYDEAAGTFETRSSAGVGLYAAAAILDAAAQIETTTPSPTPTPKHRSSRFGFVSEAHAAAPERPAMEPAVAAAKLALQDEAFVRGFGSYGGEEHVSYMVTTEAMARVKGEDWVKWGRQIAARLASIQRPDGLWRGDHCITSTTFCTAASLVTLALLPDVVGDPPSAR